MSNIPRPCNKICEYKSPSGYCSMTACIKQYNVCLTSGIKPSNPYLNMNIDTSSFEDCIFCKYDFEKGDVLYNRTSCDKGMVFEEVTVNYCPVCGRKLGWSE